MMTAVKSTADGVAVGIYRDADKQVPVMLHTNTKGMISQDALGDLAVWNGTNSAPLAQLADSISTGWEWPLMKTYNRRLSMAAQCDVKHGHTMKEVHAEIRNEIEQIKLPPGYTFFWDSQYKDQQRGHGRTDQVFSTGHSIPGGNPRNAIRQLQATANNISHSSTLNHRRSCPACSSRVSNSVSSALPDGSDCWV